jgi:putative two-component system protein, hydrogenase maturation factor HypX/HoxX
VSLRILFICTAFNGLSQRAWGELRDLGHDVDVLAGANAQGMCARVERYRPDLIVAPMLKSAIPEEIWRHHTCLIVHPGIVGDRGPSSLDWAILEAETQWGITVLQADAEMDAGDIWTSAAFATRPVSKSQLYRHEVTDASIAALLEAVSRFERHDFRPRPLDYAQSDVRGRLRAAMKPSDRAIDWTMGTDEILRRVRCGDSFPGARGEIAGITCHLFGATREHGLRGRPGELLAQRDGAVCLATGDGAVWLSHLRTRDGISCPRPRCWVRCAWSTCRSGRPRRKGAPRAIARSTIAKTARSATCISISTTGRCPRSNAIAYAPRSCMRSNVRRARSCSWAGRTSGPTASTSTRSKPQSIQR